MKAEVEDDRELPRKSRISPLGCALAFGVCFIVITQLLGLVLVTSEQVGEIEESSPLPPCSGVPPSEEDSSPIAAKRSGARPQLGSPAHGQQTVRP